jgi:hypothetical protein
VNPFALTWLKPLDEELYVGGDHFFGRPGFGGQEKGSDVAGFVGGGDAAQDLALPKG